MPTTRNPFAAFAATAQVGDVFDPHGMPVVVTGVLPHGGVWRTLTFSMATADPHHAEVWTNDYRTDLTPPPPDPATALPESDRIAFGLPADPTIERN